MRTPALSFLADTPNAISNAFSVDFSPIIVLGWIWRVLCEPTVYAE